ncbi:hypothetical protein A374_08109 [Fictibacillus macauensis ZFHKF-1]|uniref:Uncharacterized protein n=2 Tax=Fictibacillus TaxID=1329200 RepID=I8UG27_9BACL|nr:hypothetical protein A374_08109 [Fictibacillus macauensis ZFHKF-1]
MIQVQRMIVQTTMSRLPVKQESNQDFFIGYDHKEMPYLLLPTAPGLLSEEECFALPFERDLYNSYKYTLNYAKTIVNLEELTLFIDHLSFFFGPDQNMLRVYLQSKHYETFVEWSEEKQSKKIQEALFNYENVSSLEEKKKYTNLLMQLLKR